MTIIYDPVLKMLGDRVIGFQNASGEKRHGGVDPAAALLAAVVEHDTVGGIGYSLGHSAVSCFIVRPRHMSGTLAGALICSCNAPRGSPSCRNRHQHQREDI